MKKQISILMLFLAFTFAATAQSLNNYIDVVYLKNGSKIKGIIVEQVLGKTIKIETRDGSQYVYNIDQVEKLAREEIIIKETKAPKYMDNFKRKERGFFMNLDALANGVGGGIRLTHGYRFNRFRNFGIALGLESLNLNNYFGYSTPSLSLNLIYSGEILDKRISPFYQLEAGYGFALKRQNNDSFYEYEDDVFYEYYGEERKNYGGPMAGLALGVKFATKKKIYYKLALDARIVSNFANVTSYYPNDPLSSYIEPTQYRDFTTNPGAGIRFGIGF